MLTSKLLVLIAAISGLLAVALGAFGAHALKAQLEPSMMSVYQTSVQYHFWHTLALLGVGLYHQARPGRLSAWSGVLIIVGMLLFSGSLYLMSILDVRALGMITPVGGVTLMAGWLALALAVWRS